MHFKSVKPFNSHIKLSHFGKKKSPFAQLTLISQIETVALIKIVSFRLISFSFYLFKVFFHSASGLSDQDSLKLLDVTYFRRYTVNASFRRYVRCNNLSVHKLFHPDGVFAIFIPRHFPEDFDTLFYSLRFLFPRLACF